MPKISSIYLGYKALRELGPKQVGLYAWYRIGLRSGYLRWKTRGVDKGARHQASTPGQLNYSWLKMPSSEIIRSTIGPEGLRQLFAVADEIVDGQVRLFGGPPVDLELEPPEPVHHWTAYERGQPLVSEKDIKWIWEPGRFGWAQTLARAYHLSKDEKYSQVFWTYTEAFLDSNPPNLGPNWVSAQEVAVRLMAMVFSSRLLIEASSTSSERLDRLAEAIASHSQRIPPTLSYARAQNNNHLLTEAAGMLTASLVLPEHPEAGRWKKDGWRWLNHGLQEQIAADGAYAQHSANYHRLMLQVALWVSLVLNRELPPETGARLAAATRWLLELVDSENGRAPNLGPNDSAYILPWTVCPQDDFRPVLQAASLDFLDTPAYQPGAWDEMSLWYGIDASRLNAHSSGARTMNTHAHNQGKHSPVVVRGDDSWAYLRAAQFNERPGHADQLHVDLWWRGLNIAQDAGTYLYNAEPPWDNALAPTGVHNTITIENQDQMKRAGRFLWLDWAQGEIIEQGHEGQNTWRRAAAQHDGYERLGVLHQRHVEVKENNWTIEDRIERTGRTAGRSAILKSPCLVRVHWLLPDWPWNVKERVKEMGADLRVDSPHGWIKLRVGLSQDRQPPVGELHQKVQIYRAGEAIYGRGNSSPTRGWISRNYGYKSPALSFSIEVENQLPITILSEWILPT